MNSPFKPGRIGFVTSKAIHYVYLEDFPTPQAFANHCHRVVDAAIISVVNENVGKDK